MRTLSRRWTTSFVLLTAVLTSVTVVAPSQAAELRVDRACKAVEGVFARGSGQELGESEYLKFESELTDRLGEANFDTYEVGFETYGSSKYPAVAVDGWSTGVAVDAKITSGGALHYGNSVNTGVAELAAYLEERQLKCSSTLFVLGGYSQGAQVIGETYVEKLTDPQRASIVYNALFGDPKLYLPEGKGFDPPFCRGLDRSEWRRTVPNCHTDNGSLNSRTTYLPNGWTSNTGLYCNDHDFVCGSSKWPFTTSGHMTYGDAGGAIEDAALEAALLLKARLPAATGDTLNVDIRIIGTGTTGTDVVFVIDSTGSMSYDIDAAVRYASTMATAITALRGRVALVEYRDAGDAFVSVVRAPLSSDIAPFQTALGAITVGGGGDIPEALLSALMTAFDGLDWKAGATKAAVVLTDAGFHNPDVETGATLETVAKRALEIDPVNVYAVVPEYLEAEYAPLAAATTGAVILNTGDTAAALTTALDLIAARPVPLLPLTGYSGAPGDEFSFDASDSYVIDSTITEYAFDFDGDGVFETSGSEPVASHVYPVNFDGVMQVRVTAADGGVASASATVTVSDVVPAPVGPGLPTGMSVQAVSTVENVSTVRLSWSAADDTAVTWGIAVNGIPVGLIDGDLRSLEITDVVRSEETLFSVSGLDDAAMGLTASVTLARAVPAVVIPPTPTQSPAPAGTQPDATSPSGTAGLTSDPIARATAAKPGTALVVAGADAWTTVVLALGFLGAGAGAILFVSVRRRRSAEGH